MFDPLEAAFEKQWLKEGKEIFFIAIIITAM